MPINQEVIYNLTDYLTLIQCIPSLPWMRLMCSLICEWKEHSDPSAGQKDWKNLHRGPTSPPGAPGVHCGGLTHKEHCTGCSLHIDAVLNAVLSREI